MFPDSVAFGDGEGFVGQVTFLVLYIFSPLREGLLGEVHVGFAVVVM